MAAFHLGRPKKGESMNDNTPIYDTVVVEAMEFDMLPSFEPIDTHEEFLTRHEFNRWRQDTEAKVRATHQGGLAAATLRSIQ